MVSCGLWIIHFAAAKLIFLVFASALIFFKVSLTLATLARQLVGEQRRASALETSLSGVYVDECVMSAIARRLATTFIAVSSLSTLIEKPDLARGGSDSGKSFAQDVEEEEHD